MFSHPPEPPSLATDLISFAHSRDVPRVNVTWTQTEKSSQDSRALAAAARDDPDVNVVGSAVVFEVSSLLLCARSQKLREIILSTNNSFVTSSIQRSESAPKSPALTNNTPPQSIGTTGNTPTTSAYTSFGGPEPTAPPTTTVALKAPDVHRMMDDVDAKVQLIHISDLSFRSLKNIISYIKTDKCPLLEESAPCLKHLLDLLNACHLYKVDSLKWRAVRVLMGRLTNDSDCQQVAQVAMDLDIMELLTECKKFSDNAVRPAAKKDLLAAAPGLRGAP